MIVIPLSKLAPLHVNRNFVFKFSVDAGENAFEWDLVPRLLQKKITSTWVFILSSKYKMSQSKIDIIFAWMLITIEVPFIKLSLYRTSLK